MRRTSELRAWIACCVTAWAGWADSAAILAAEPTFSGAFADGAYVVGGQLQDWHGSGSAPEAE